eukprot:4735076-Prymnesium_polylepis.1
MGSNPRTDVLRPDAITAALIARVSPDALPCAPSHEGTTYTRHAQPGRAPASSAHSPHQP